jgi:hypothetical protein
MKFFSSLLTPSSPGINLSSYPVGTWCKLSGEWNLIAQLHIVRRLRMCGIRPPHLHCRWGKLYLGQWIVFLTTEPDILVGVKLLHTVMVGGDGGFVEWRRDIKHTLNGLTSDTFLCLECDAHWYVSVLTWLLICRMRNCNRNCSCRTLERSSVPQRDVTILWVCVQSSFRNLIMDKCGVFFLMRRHIGRAVVWSWFIWGEGDLINCRSNYYYKI